MRVDNIRELAGYSNLFVMLIPILLLWFHELTWDAFLSAFRTPGLLCNVEVNTFKAIELAALSTEPWIDSHCGAEIAQERGLFFTAEGNALGLDLFYFRESFGNSHL
jgi:hypothetical protein